MYDSYLAAIAEGGSVLDVRACGARMRIVEAKPHPRHEDTELWVYKCVECDHELRVLKAAIAT